jgi:hypothetical protein
MRIGVTGHQRLKDPSGWQWVELEFNALLHSLPQPFTGITSLAIGADQLFARAVLRRGGSLEVITPFAGYERTFDRRQDRQEYYRLLRFASRVEVLEKPGSDEEAYFASGKKVVDLSTLIVAVWDGRPAAGLGGTGDVVNYAAQQFKRTIHLNPITREVALRKTRLKP